MTPKEKAKELFNKYWDLLALHNVLHRKLFTKECALIAVDEILQMVDETMQGWLDADIIAYWKQVKEEIEKL